MTKSGHPNSPAFVNLKKPGNQADLELARGGG